MRRAAGAQDAQRRVLRTGNLEAQQAVRSGNQVRCVAGATVATLLRHECEERLAKCSVGLALVGADSCMYDCRVAFSMQFAASLQARNVEVCSAMRRARLMLRVRSTMCCARATMQGHAVVTCGILSPMGMAREQ